MRLTELKMQHTIHLKRKTEVDAVNIQLYLPNVLWVAFSIPSSTLLGNVYAKVLDFLVLQFLTYTNVIISELSYLFLFLPTRVIRAINITVGTL
jgi:hypothetical protein